MTEGHLQCWPAGSPSARVLSNLGEGFTQGQVRTWSQNAHQSEPPPLAIAIGTDSIRAVPMLPDWRVQSSDTLFRCTPGYQIAAGGVQACSEVVQQGSKLFFCEQAASGARRLTTLDIHSREASHSSPLPSDVRIGPAVTDGGIVWMLGESGLSRLANGAWNPVPLPAGIRPFLNPEDRRRLAVNTASAPGLYGVPEGVYWIGHSSDKTTVFFSDAQHLPAHIPQGGTFVSGNGYHTTTGDGAIYRHDHGARSSPIVIDSEVHSGYGAYLLDDHYVAYFVRRAGALLSLRLRNTLDTAYCDLPLPEDFGETYSLGAVDHTIFLAYKVEAGDGIGLTAWDLWKK